MKGRLRLRKGKNRHGLRPNWGFAPAPKGEEKAALKSSGYERPIKTAIGKETRFEDATMRQASPSPLPIARSGARRWRLNPKLFRTNQNKGAKTPIDAKAIFRPVEATSLSVGKSPPKNYLDAILRLPVRP